MYSDGFTLGRRPPEYNQYGVVKGDGVENSSVVTAAAAHVGDGMSLEIVF